MAVLTAVALALSGSHSWVLVHKVEFCLLVGALIVVCLIHPANTGQVPNEFRTLRLNYIGWLISRLISRHLIGAIVIVDLTLKLLAE